MRYILYSAIIFLGLGPAAQSQSVKLPEFLPPSPDVAAITKGAELSSSPHTGAANASIPIYTLKVRDFSLPVSLNYSSNGFKPLENVSRVGCGWSLNAGGVISRIQRGKPDDYSTTPTPKTVSELLQYDAAAFYYLTGLEDDGYTYDAQPDEYRYSFNGISGKFFILRNDSILNMPHSNLKISVVKNLGVVESIYITDDKGTRYAFGYNGKIEKTLSLNMQNGFLQKQQLNTAYMLTKITLANGDYIDLNYNSIDHRSFPGKSESVTKVYDWEACNIENEPACDVSLQYSSSQPYNIKYRSYYLTSIVANTGPSLSFGYEDRPDTSGDNRLKTILASNGSIYVKSMELEYNNSYGSTPAYETNSKFFLKKVLVKDPTGGSAPSQEYMLKYLYNTNEYEISGGEDHLGFATDGISSTPMPPLTETEMIFENYITSKHPNGEKSKIGMLHRITYPTGGYDEFHYEPNMTSTWDSVWRVDIISAKAMGVGATSNYPVYTKTFTVAKNQTAEFHLNSNWMAVNTPIPDGNPAPKTAIAILRDNSNSSVVARRDAYGCAGGDHYEVDGPQTFSLGPGSYTLELEVRYGDSVLARADIVYDSASTKEWKNTKEELCGVRVRKIINYDPVSNKSVSKFYRYEKLDDSTAISANKLYYPQYISENTTVLACPGNLTNKFCFSKVWSNNSVAATINDAAGVVYNWVIESDDSLFANGGVEHTFMQQGQLLGANVIGSDIPGRPTDPYNYLNGLTTQQVYFNSEKETVKKINHYYSYDTGFSKIQSLNYFVRKRYEPIITQSISQAAFAKFDVMEYGVYSAWNHLDSTVTRDYDLVNDKVMVSKVAYSFGNPVNTQPLAMRTTGSDNVELRTEYKYPTDFPGEAVCSTMIEKNMIQPAVQEESYKDAKLLYKTATDYKDWFSNGNILAPELIKKQKGNESLETRIRFSQYNTAGTPLELAKENDIPVTYIWDYNGTLPIAEVSNASYGSGVAYTSFEADGKGGWTFSGTPTSEGTQPVGNKCYSLAFGNITYPSGLTTSEKYAVSYWAKSGATVSINGGSATSMLTKNGWSLYRIVITYSGSGGITVSGTGYIDELRLHPELAIVKTFAYTPEIGITVTGDNNNLYQKYEYDVFNRLLRIRDMDSNILKQMEYKYGQTITPCANTSANWVATGTYRCAQANAWSNSNTGVREREELDKNNCSETYGQTRWVSVGTSGLCPTVSNCTAADKRVVNGVCETGCKTLVRSVYNGLLNWTCFFRYEWSDGFKGPEFWEGTTSSCMGGPCD